jgi:hypothetical protein
MDDYHILFPHTRQVPFESSVPNYTSPTGNYLPPEELLRSMNYTGPRVREGRYPSQLWFLGTERKLDLWLHTREVRLSFLKADTAHLPDGPYWEDDYLGPVADEDEFISLLQHYNWLPKTTPDHAHPVHDVSL